MNRHRIVGRRPLALAAATTMALGLATTGSAGASSRAGSASVSNDTLTVVGTRHADQVALRLAAGDPTTLHIDLGDDGSAEHSFDRDTFSRILVFLGRGDDALRVDQVNGSFGDEALTVFAGAGDDAIAGGDGNELVLGDQGDDSFDGNRGVDTAVLGSGRDSFTWDPGDGSDVIHGGGGSDTLVFNGSDQAEVMRLSANGRSSLFQRDPGNIRMDMSSVEVLDLAALGGADTITVDDLRHTSFRHADIDLSTLGAGDGQRDVVTVNGTEARDRVDVDAYGTQVEVRGLQARTRLTGSETMDRLQVNTLGGRDTVDVDAAARALIEVAVDLGAGQS